VELPTQIGEDAFQEPAVDLDPRHPLEEQALVEPPLPDLVYLDDTPGTQLEFVSAGHA
jgi:hypothetical protein